MQSLLSSIIVLLKCTAYSEVRVHAYNPAHGRNKQSNSRQKPTNKMPGGGSPRPLSPIRLHRRMTELVLKKERSSVVSLPLGEPHEWELA